MSRSIKRAVLFIACFSLISIFAFFAMAATDAQGECGKNVGWSYADGTLTVSGKGAMTSFDSVTAQPWQQYKDEITKVVIEEGVTSVGRCAFYGFEAITEVTLPESLTSIEQYAFFSCKGLTALEIPKNVIFIGQYSFRKSAIADISFADAAGWEFIDGTALADVDTVAAFKTAGTYKLNCAKLEKGTGAIVAGGRFYGNTFAWSLDDNGVLTVSGEGDMPKLSATTTPWYDYSASIKSVIIEEGITSIARCSFHSCYSITSVELPETLETIGEYAFYNCNSLNSVKIPSAVTEIGIFAFRKCSSLTSATFENTDGWSVSDLTANGLCSNYLTVWTRSEHTHGFDHDYDKDCNSADCDFTREIKMQSVLLIGQSNMSGRGDLNTVEPIRDDRIFMMRNNGWVKMQEPIHDTARGGAGIGASFAKAFVESFDCQLGLIPCAEGGTSLADWAVGGELYNAAVAQAKIAQETSDICAILWHQGESDQKNESYAAQLEVIFDAMIEELGLDADKLVIVTGELFGTRSDAVHMAQLELLAKEYKNYGIALSDGLTVFDVTTHFDAPSLRVFGYRYFDIFYNRITGGHYEFDQNPENYRVEPPAPEPNAPIISEDFNALATGNAVSVSKKVEYAPKSGTITVEALSDSEKYLRLTTGLADATKYGDTYVDFYNSIDAGSVIIMEAKFKLGSSLTTSADLFKLVGGTTLRTVRLNANGKLYNMTGSTVGEYLGYSLDTLEWTNIKVVLDLKNNVKNIYILDKLVLVAEIYESDVSQNLSNRTRLVQFIQTTKGQSDILVDDYSCRYGTSADVERNVNYIANESFDGFVSDTVYTEGVTVDKIQFNNVTSKSYIKVVSRGNHNNCLEVMRGSDNKGTYVDLKYPISANTKFVIEGSFKLGEGKAAADLLKITPSSGSYNLIYLNTKGELCDWVYTDGVGAQGEVIGKLSEDAWTNIKIVCDLKNNTKEIYINGKLVKNGLICDSSTADVRITKCRVIQMKSGAGSVYVDDVAYYTE